MTTDWTPEQTARPADGPKRLSVEAGKLWAGGVATALIAALIAIVGIVVARGIFDIAVLAPKKSGTWGDADTGTYALAAFGIGLLATALIHLLLVSTPSPFAFFGWVVGLCTILAALAPFATDGDLASKVSTAVINALIGIAIWSLTDSNARRSIRRDPMPGRIPPGGPYVA